MRHLINTSNLILLQLVLAASVIASGLENAAAATDLTRVEQAGGSWQECADIPWKVQELYGTTRDGKVIIAGGMALSEADAPVGIDRTGIYDPATDTWTEGPALPAGRHHALMISAGGRIYAVGGATHGASKGHWQSRREVYVLDRTGGWSTLTQMPVDQTEAMAVEHEGRIHILGGRTPNFDDASRWSEYRDVDWHTVYDIQSNTWSTAAALPSPRNSAAVAIIDGLIYVAGGRTMKGGNIANLDRYDPVTDEWQSLSPMPYAAGGFNGAAVGGKFYVFGGEELGVLGADGVFAQSMRYDPETDQWQALPNLPTARHGHAVVPVQGSLFVIGGGAHTATGMTTNTLEVYTPEGNYPPVSCQHRDASR